MNYDNIEIGNLLFGNSRGEYPIEREVNQDLFVNFLYEFNLIDYGEGETLTNMDNNGYENDVFKIQPYYWGDDEKIAAEPNFIFKPLNIEIQWYKYPFRDSYSNVELTTDMLKDIIQQCRESLKK